MSSQGLSSGRIRSGFRRALSLIVLLALLPPSLQAATRIVRLGERSFELRHSSALSAAGGGEAGLMEVTVKAAHLCALLGFRYVVAEAVDQYQSPRTGIATRSGSTVVAVTCHTAEEPPEVGLETLDVRAIDLSDVEIRKKVKAALEAMEAEEERQRRSEKARLAKGPEWLAEEERKAAEKEEERQARIRRLDEEAFEKAKRKLQHKADKRRKRSAVPPETSDRKGV